jgi:DNA polymerase III delta prime subunit
MINSITEFRGQPVALRLAARAIERGLLSGTLLFCGSRGLGKTTLAHVVGLAVNCENTRAGEPLAFCGECYACRTILAGEQPEFTEIRPIGQDIRVEQFEGSKSRSVKDDQEGRHEYSVFHAALMGPAYIRRRVFLIDSAHYLNRATGNQLLKLLEEAPAQTLFILVSERPQLMLPTILSRSRRFDLVPLALDELSRFVEQDCAGVDAVVAEESACMAAGRYVDAIALAANADWREAVKSLAGAFATGGTVSQQLDQLTPHELQLLLSAELPGGVPPEEALAQLTGPRRNELRRQALIGAIDRAAWWALRSQSPPSGFGERIAKLKARINQNVDPALATAAFGSTE